MVLFERIASVTSNAVFPYTTTRIGVGTQIPQGKLHVHEGSVLYTSNTTPNVRRYPPAPMTADTTTISSALYGNGTYIVQNQNGGAAVQPLFQAFNWSIVSIFASGNSGLYDNGVYVGTALSVNVTGVTKTYVAHDFDVKLPVGIVVKDVYMRVDVPASIPSGFVLLGTNNDGTLWEEVVVVSGLTNTTNIENTYAINASKSYSRYKFLVTGMAITTGGTRLRIAEFYFMGYETTTSSAVVTITQNGNVGVGTTAPQEELHVHNGTIMSSYITTTISEDRSYPPSFAYTNDQTLLSGQTYGNGSYIFWSGNTTNDTNKQLYRMFDTTATVGWKPVMNFTNNVWNGSIPIFVNGVSYLGPEANFQLPVAITPKSIAVRYVTNVPTDHYFFGSRDSMNWDVLYTRVGETGLNNTQTFTFNLNATTNQYSYFKYIVTRIGVAIPESGLEIGDFRVVGFETTSNMATGIYTLQDRIGIGTNAPQEALHVHGSNMRVGTVAVQATYATTNTYMIPPVASGSINGVNVTALNKRVRQSTGAVQTSMNSWALHVLPQPSQAEIASTFRSIAWSPELNLMVAVSSNVAATNYVYYSSDLINWYPSTLDVPSSTGWTSVCWASNVPSVNQGRFVAVAESGNSRFMWSSNGIEWVPVSTTGTFLTTWNSVCWAPTLGNGARFIAVANSGTNRLAFSTNGISWTMSTNTGITGNWRSVAYGSNATINRLVAVGDSLGTNRIAHSTDGNTWTGIAGTANTWNSVCWTGSAFVAVAGSGATNRVMWSSDGITWNNVSTTVTNSSTWRSVIYVPQSDRVVAVADSGTQRVMWSSNTTTWNAVTTPLNSWAAQAWSPALGRIVAIAESSTNRLMTSMSNAESWATNISMISVNSNITRSVCWSPDLKMFIGVGQFGSNSVVQSSDGMNWNIIPSSSTGVHVPLWRSVCWAPGSSNTDVTQSRYGRFVAVASSGINGSNVMWSSDGTQWTNISASGSQWTSVCYAPELGRLVTVAEGGASLVAYSMNGGVVWQTMSTGVDANQWQSVCWAPEAGLFVAVAASGTNRVMWSENGITWTSVNTGVSATSEWSSVCWSPELGEFVAVARAGSPSVMYSATGKTWVSTVAGVPSGVEWRSVCWAPEINAFVAFGRTGSQRIMYSYDGINWIGVSNSEGSWVSGCWAPELGVFCAVADDTVGNGRVTISAVGIATPSASRFDRMMVGTQIGRSNYALQGTNKVLQFPTANGRINGVNITSLNRLARVSNDTANRCVNTWTDRTISATSRTWSASAWSPEIARVVMLASGLNIAATSSDGIVWTEMSMSGVTARAWSSMCWSAELGLFVAVATNTNVCVTSTGGINWVERRMTNTREWRSVCWSPELGLFVIAAANVNVCATSPDGITWTERVISSMPRPWGSVCWAPELNVFVMVGTNVAAVSYDGYNWVEVSTSINTLPTSVCWSGELGLFVAAATFTKSCFTSPDGYVWTERLFDVGAELNWTSVTWAAEMGMFVIVARSSLLCMTSQDGINWVFRVIRGVDRDNESVIWANSLGIFIVSGSDSTCTTSTFLPAPLNTLMAPQSQVTINNVTGNVGIGTTTPLRTLHVQGDINFTGAVASNGINMMSNGILLDNALSNAASATGVFGSSTQIPMLNIDTKGRVISAGVCNIVSSQWTTSGSTVYIQNSNVGIGTVTPLNTLHVQGGVSVGSQFINTGYTSLSNVYQVPTSDGRINSVNITALNKRTRVSNATVRRCIRTWVNRTISSNRDWLTICWSPELGVFVMMPESGNAFAISTDSITWTDVVLTNSRTWRAICWSAEHGLFVAVANGWRGVIASSNATVWTEYPNVIPAVVTPNDPWQSICWAPELNRFVALSYDNSYVAYSSTPTTSWQITQAIPTRSWKMVTWAPEIRTFVGIAHSSSNCATSSDGITWSSQTVSGSLLQFPSIAWSGELGIFVMCAQDTILTSPNGITWTSRTVPFASLWRSVCWSAELGLFVIVSGTSMNQCIVSYDGINWVAQNMTTAMQREMICWSPELGVFASPGRFTTSCTVSEMDYPAPLNTLMAPQSQACVTNSSIVQEVLNYTNGSVVYDPVQIPPNTLTTTPATFTYDTKTFRVTHWQGNTIWDTPWLYDNGNGNAQFGSFNSDGSLVLANLPSPTNGVQGPYIQIATNPAASFSISGWRVVFYSFTGYTCVNIRRAVTFGSPDNGTTWVQIDDYSLSQSEASVTDYTRQFPFSATYTAYRVVFNTSWGNTIQTNANIFLSEVRWSYGFNSSIPGTFTINTITTLQTSTLGLGIGTTQPLARLHVQGNTLIGTNFKRYSYQQVGSNMQLPTSDGTMNGVNVTVLNKKSRPSAATVLSCLSWTDRQNSTGGNQPLYDVRWCYDRFVAVGNNKWLSSVDGITWTERTIPSTLITWGKVVFLPEASLTLAFSTTTSTQSYLISTNLATIQIFSLFPVSITVKGACWAREIFTLVVTTNNNTGYVSRDGYTWSSTTILTGGTTYEWRDVCWSPELGLFVAIAFNSTICCTSPDGTTWSQRTLPGTSTSWSVCTWSPELGLFVVLDNTNRTARSSDGINWLAGTVNSGTNRSFVSLKWCDQLCIFIAVVNGTNVYAYSFDGITWTEATLSSSRNWNAIDWSPELGVFVVVADSTNQVSMSAFDYPAPLNTLMAPQSQVTINTVTGNVGIGKTNPQVLLDVSGNMRIGSNAIMPVYTTSNTYLSVPCTNGRINDVNITALNERTRQSIGAVNTCMSSWTLRATPMQNEPQLPFKALCFSPELARIVTVTSNASGTNLVYYSSDGINWIPTNIGVNASVGWTSMCWASNVSSVGGGRFVAVADSGTNRVMWSSNGIQWQSVATTGNLSTTWKSVCWAPGVGGGRFVAVADSGATDRIMWSSNPSQWFSVANTSNNTWSSVAASTTNVLVAVGTSGAPVLRSTDASNWTPITAGVSNSAWQSVCWSNVVPTSGRFIAIANGTTLTNQLMGSADGTSWTMSNVVAGQSITYASNNGRLWVVGYSNTSTPGRHAYYSTNGGNSWSPVDANPLAQWFNVTYTSSSFPQQLVAVATSGTVRSASRSIGVANNTFTPFTGRGIITNRFTNICWSPELRLFAGVGTFGSNVVATSSDGISWSLTSGITQLNAWTNVCWAPGISNTNITAASSTFGRFVAVASEGGTQRVMWSSNATQWFGTSTGVVDNQWTSVCWAQEIQLLVAVASSGTTRAMYSADGLAWSTMGITGVDLNTWTSVCWAPELRMFVAVASSGTNRAMWSSDGITWTSVAITASTWRSVCWSPEIGRFVAVASADASRVAYSSDGVTWTTTSAGNNINTSEWYSVVWAPELSAYVAVSQTSSRVMYSFDAINWIVTSNLPTAALVASTTGTRWISHCWAPELGMFVVVGSDDNDQHATNALVATSAIGMVTPTASRLDRSQIGSQFLQTSYNVLGSSSNVLRLPTSDGQINGVNITTLNKRTRVSATTALKCVSTWIDRSIGSSGSWASICWSSERGLFVAIQTGTSCITSSDGISWTSRTISATSRTWNTVCWSPELGLFVALISTDFANIGYVAVSSDGITWQEYSSIVASQYTSICWSPELSMFVAVSIAPNANNPSIVSTSVNGIDWTARVLNTSAFAWYGICWSPELGLFVAVCSTTATGNTTTYATSVNGIVWTQRVMPVSAAWYGVCWSAELGIFVAIATGTQVCVTSRDGINWTQWTLPSIQNWRSVTWAQEIGMFVVVANNATVVAVSLDGVTWSSQTISVTARAYRSICWSPDLGIFAACGNSMSMVVTSEMDYPTPLNTLMALQSQVTINTASGNVGIGTTNPEVALDVRMSSNLPNNVGCNIAIFRNSTGTRLRIIDETSTKPGGVYSTTGAGLGLHADWNIVMYTGSSLTERMRINSVGNVGIGKTNPTALLDLGTNSGTALNLTSGNNGSVFTANQMTMEWSGSGGGYRHAIKTRHTATVNDGVNNSVDFYVWQTSDAPASIGTKHVMSATGSGVGIGTTSPDRSLHVYNASYIKIDGGSNTDVGLEICQTNCNVNVNRWAIYREAHTSNLNMFYSGAPNNGSVLCCAPTGNVGIGTLTNLGKLHIHEATGTTPNGTTGSLVLSHGNSGGVSTIMFQSKVNTGSDYGYIAFYDNVATSGNGLNYFNINANTETAALVIGCENDNAAMSSPDNVIIKPAGNIVLNPGNGKTYITGSVGIGTTNPTTQLEIQHDSSQAIRVISSTCNTFPVEIVFDKTIGASANNKAAVGVAANDTTRVTGFFIWVNGTDRMVINNDGNVGIGTSNPNYTLDVFRSAGGSSPTAPGRIYCTDGGVGETGIRVGIKIAGGDFKPLAVYNNGTEVVTYRNSSVGIGTTNPQATLDINGSVMMYSGGTDINKTSFGLTGTYNNFIRGSTIIADSIGCNVGIGFGSPAFKLDVYQSMVGLTTATCRIQCTDAGVSETGIRVAQKVAALDFKPLAVWNNNVEVVTFRNERVGIGVTNPGTALHVQGSITYTGTSGTSDIRLKDNIKRLANCSDKVNRLNAYSYTRKDYHKLDHPASKLYFGFIAQELINIIPEVVHYDIENDMYTLDYISIIPFLTETIKEQQKQIQHLEAFIQSKFSDYSPLASNT